MFFFQGVGLRLVPPSLADVVGQHSTYPEPRYSWAHCRDCGARVGWSESTCSSCGEAQRSVESDRNPDVAAAISVVMPGAGHLYVGDRKRGVVQFFPTVVLAALILGRLPQGGSFGVVGPVALFALQWLSSALSAAHHARVRAEETNYGLGPKADTEACSDCDAPNPESASYCRNCGLEFPETWAGPTETTYRFRTRDGVCFCERCDVQVSPSDRTCPSCDYELRVKEPIRA